MRTRVEILLFVLLLAGAAWAITTGGSGVAQRERWPSYARGMVLTAAAATLGPTAPNLQSIVDSGGIVVARGYGFDSTAGESLTNARCVPSDWDGASNFTLTIIWTNQNGDVMQATEDVDWYARYRTVAEGEAYEVAAATSVLGSYTQEGAGTDSENIHTDLTIAYNDGTNPLTVGDCLAIEIQRNVGGTESNSYSGEAVIMRTVLWINSTGLPIIN